MPSGLDSSIASFRILNLICLDLSRHLNQIQRTLDGNFQCNQFNKNTDPDDVSLCAGKGYFPLDSEYKEYMARIPVSKEVCYVLMNAFLTSEMAMRNQRVTI